jgi:hypothetical protein
MAAERLRSFAAQILPAGQKTGIEAMYEDLATSDE